MGITSADDVGSSNWINDDESWWIDEIRMVTKISQRFADSADFSFIFVKLKLSDVQTLRN